MKSKHTPVIAVLALLAAALVPTRAEDPAYTDIDAENFIIARGISDRSEISRIHAWYRGIKGLNLWSDIVHACTYREVHNSFSVSTVGTMVGGNGTMVGSLQFNNQGVIFTGNNANYIHFPNPLPNPAVEYTILTVFQSARPSGTYYALFGSYSGAANRGPALFAYGSPQQGLNGSFYYHYYSADGATSPGDIISGSGPVLSPTLDNFSFLAAGVNATTRRVYSGVGRINESSGSFGTVWNGNATYRLGQTLDASIPLNGTVAFTAVWDRVLTTVELNAVRRLYSKTIGYGVMQRVGFVYDGDSLTAGHSGSVNPFPLVLARDTDYGAVAHHRNVATSGHTSAQMLAGIRADLYPSNIEFDFLSRQYYFLYGGANDSPPLDPAQSVETLKECWKIARDAGYRVVAFTFPDIAMLDVPGTSITAKDRRVFRATVNRLIRESAGSYDYLIELDRIPQLQDQNNSTYYESDAIHYKQPGCDLIAAAIKAKIPNP
jgi:hypothetical protein